MTTQSRPGKSLTEQAVPLLALSTLGIVGIVVIYALAPGLQPLELILMVVVVGFSIAGYVRGIIRGIMTGVIQYIATGVAVTFYQVAAPYTGAIWWLLTLPFTGDVSPLSTGAVDRNSLAFSFALLTAIIWGALEILVRAFFRDTSLPGLRILDNLGGLATHLVIGVLVASLLFTTVGYGGLRDMHNKALLRPTFNKILFLHYKTQSFWFPEAPPPLYVYDLNTQ